MKPRTTKQSSVGELSFGATNMEKTSRMARMTIENPNAIQLYSAATPNGNK